MSRLTRDYSPFDRLIGHFDQALRTVLGAPAITGRPNPADDVPAAPIEERGALESVRLMRVNHTGEVCAQALYQGQALTARDPRVREAMEEASAEENDHLAWCSERVTELGGRTSLLSPLFYIGSLTIGAAAGMAGDKWSLGFLAETEHQVVRHLDGHLQRLPVDDAKSRAIVEQMKEDEAKHATTALAAGGVSLPWPIPRLMQLSSNLMTRTTYWI